MPSPSPTSTTSRPVRLKRNADFVRVQSEGRRVRGRHLVLIFARAPGSEPAHRVGLTVSRKVGNAVTRNRVKRWLREAERRVDLGAGVYDFVLVALPSAADAGYAALLSDVLDLVRRTRR